MGFRFYKSLKCVRKLKFCESTLENVCKENGNILIFRNSQISIKMYFIDSP